MTRPKSERRSREPGASLVGPVIPASYLRARVHALGVLALLGYLGLAVLSYTQAAAVWRTVSAPRAQAFFDGIAAWLGPSWPAVASWFAAGQWPADNVSVMVVYSAVLAVPTLAYAALLALLGTHKSAGGDDCVASIKRWTVVFAAISALAHPVFTQDFWLSALWGRMIATGQNPYHQPFTDADIGNLPLDHFPMPMSYGPLWGLISGGVMLVGGGNLIVVAVLFKLVLMAAWCGCLWCVDKICETTAPGRRALCVAVLGWAPAGVGQALAEGHNDVVMVAFILLWLAMLTHRRREAPIALVASVLCKYVSLPLAAVELVVLLRSGTDLRRTVLRVLAPTVVGLAVMAIFFRSLSFFDGLLIINDWHFLRLRDAIRGLEGLIGLPLSYVGIAVSLVFPIFAARQFLIAYRDSSLENLIALAIAVMAAVLFGFIAHVWPWYLIWGLGLAALDPAWWISRFIIGVSIASPFTLASWWIAGMEDQRDLVSLGTYAFAVLWTAYPTIRRAVDGENVLKRTVDAENRV